MDGLVDSLVILRIENFVLFMLLRAMTTLILEFEGNSLVSKKFQ